MANNKECIIVFAKYPQPGKVKTRLAKSIGNKKAVNLYRMLAEKEIAEADKTGIDIVVAVSHIKDKKRFKKWLGKERPYIGQRGKGLGLRMKNAFRQVFKMGYAKAVLIGTDCPELDAAALKTAFRKLRKTKIVIGPALTAGII